MSSNPSTAKTITKKTNAFSFPEAAEEKHGQIRQTKMKDVVRGEAEKRNRQRTQVLEGKEQLKASWKFRC